MDTSNTIQQEIAAPDKITTINKRTVRTQTNSFGSTRWLTYAGAFTALAVVMKLVGQFLTLTPSFKITLIYAIWLMAGAALGPLGGGAVCFASDVLGALIFPTGAMNPFLILGNTLYGVLAGLVYRFTPGRNAYVKFIVAGIVCTLVCTCAVNTLALYYSYGYDELMSFWAYFAAYRALQPAVAAINIAVTLSMVPLLNSLHLLPSKKSKPQKEETSDNA